MNRLCLGLFVAATAALAIGPGAAAAGDPTNPRSSSAGRPDVMALAAASAAHALPSDARPFTPAAPLAVRPAGGAQTRTSAQSSTSPPPRPLVFGYVNAGNLGQANIGSSSWRYQDLTTVAFFGLHVNSDGTLANDGGMSVWNSQDLTNLINAAHPAGVKVVVSIIQQDEGTLCSSLAAAQTTVNQVIAQINAKGVDGVNIDYEGSQATCGATGDTMSARLDNLAKLFRQQLPAGRNQLTIATYASAAYYSGGFFDIPGLSAYVDQFFVMAYDMDGNYNSGNWQGAPLNCSHYCFSPTAPLTTYNWNDQRAVSTYTAVVPKSQVILGVPYYGYTACISPLSSGRPGPNAYPYDTLAPYNQPSPQWTAPTYLDSITTNGYTGVSNWQESRETHDTAGDEPYSTWQSSSYNCWRESYWDDPVSLGAKYDLVTASGIAGAGLFALDYGGGDAGLWGAIEFHLTCPTTVVVPSSPSSTRFTVTVSPAPGCAKSVDLEEWDVSLGHGWFDLGDGLAPNANVTIDSYPGHTYAFEARAHDIYGRTDAWTPVPVMVAVPSNATPAHAFAGLYETDAYGGVHGVDSPPINISAYFGFQIARSLVQQPGGQEGGYVLDGYGALHPYGAAPAATVSAYWPGWDIARDVQLLPDGSGGYVLDGYGGLHPFAVGGNSMPAKVTATGYWPGWDVARGFVILPGGTGGFVLDAYGGLHPFSIGSNPMPVSPAGGPSFGSPLARGVALVPGTSTGYVLDGWGGVHPFNGAPSVSASAYWPNWDIARSLWITLVSGLPAGYVLDGYGGVHPVGGTAAPTSYPSWSQPLARDLSGS